MIAELTWQQLNQAERHKIDQLFGPMASHQHWHDLWLSVPNKRLSVNQPLWQIKGNNWFTHEQEQFSWPEQCANQNCLAAKQWQAWQELESQPRDQQALAELLFFSSRLHYPLSAGLTRDRGGELIFLGQGANSRSLAWIWQHGLLEQQGDWQELADNWSWQSSATNLEHWDQEQLAELVSQQHLLAMTLYRDAFNSRFNSGYVRRHRDQWHSLIEQSVWLNLSLLRLSWVEILNESP